MSSKIRLMAIIMGFVLCSLSAAQGATSSQTDNTTPRDQETQRQPAQPEVNHAVRIAPGSVIPVRLTKTVDAKKAKAGDEVDALVTQDLKAVSGDVVVSKDTKVVGHVTEAQARTKAQKESEVGIAFDHAVTKDGGVTSLPMSIQAIIAQTTQNPQNPDSGSAAPVGPVPGGMPQTSGGRPGEMGGGTPQQAPNSYPAGGQQPSPDSTGTHAQPSITANTRGVVGMSNYKLSTADDGTQGSVVSSEKDNVKLESGTLMLLRVTQ